MARVGKPSAIAALQEPRRTATIAALFHTLEAAAQDDAAELAEALLTDMVKDAEAASRDGAVGSDRRRLAVPVTALTQLAEADAFRPSLALARREALWAIKALRDEPLPLFAAAAARAAMPITEQEEPAVMLRPMTIGGEVVEDYCHTGLSLRAHPVSFLRDELVRRRIVTCAEAGSSRGGRWVDVAGLVLVRQRPGSAKSVLFMTIEDETGVANIVIWQKVFEANRRLILGSRLIGAQGPVQHEGDVVHIVARQLTDLSHELATIRTRNVDAARSSVSADTAPQTPLPFRTSFALEASETIGDTFGKPRNFR